MIEKLFWLIFAIILVFVTYQDKKTRISLITLFVVTFLDGLLFGGFYSKLLIVNPIIFGGDLIIVYVGWVLILTDDLYDYLVTFNVDLIAWLMTPVGLFWGVVVMVILILLIRIEESISKIPKNEV